VGQGASVIQDVRYAMRTLGKARAFSALAIGTLAIGIGANAAIFSVVNAAYFSRYPLREPERLVRVYGEDRASGSRQLSFSYPRFLFFRDHQTVFASFAAANYNGVALERQQQETELVPGAAITSDFLTTFGAEPLIGRFMRPAEETGGRVVVLGERLWRASFNSDAAVLGGPLTLSGNVYTIVGVAPRLPAFWDADVWLPDPFVAPGLTRELMMRGVTFLVVVARLKPDATPQLAAEDVHRLAARYHDALGGNADAGWAATVIGLRDDIVGATRAPLVALMAAVGLLLLVACANVGNLLLVRFTGRRQEISVRAALGASRGRILRQFLIESVLLGTASAVLGAALAYWTLPALVSIGSTNLPFAADIHVDPRVLMATIALAVIAALASGTLPALQASGGNAGAALRECGRTVAGPAASQAFRRLMVAGQVALSLVLLVGAALLVTSFLRLRAQPPGFDARNLFAAGINLPATRYPTPESQRRLYSELSAELNNAPGVQRAVVAQTLPLLGGFTRAPYASAEGLVPPLNQRPLGLTHSVLPGYFRTLGVPLLAGRDFTDLDTADAPLVAAVSRSTARRLFPDAADALGKHIVMGSLNGGQTMEIVGVVGDVRSQTLASIAEVEFYRPVAQRPRPFMRLLVRTHGDAAAFEPTARAVLRRLDPGLPLIGVTTGQRVLDGSLAQERLLFTLLSAFAAIALILSAVGIYGVLSQSVAQRQSEFAVRVALGAGRSAIVRLVIQESARPLATGLAAGAVLAIVVGPLVQDLLFGVSALDPRAIAACAGVLAALAAVAGAVPAWRASRIAPAEALRR
jgi:putative ABC transport system permease protein